MQSPALDPWRHRHDFSGDSAAAEKSTTLVMLLTGTMMVAEIAAGVLFGSMALLADGWHMATHVAAFAITLFAYRFARRHADNPRFSFGTGKAGALGGFSSAIVLAVVALVMAVESVLRLLQPQPIHFNEAIVVASIGLLVNLLSGYLLKGHHDHDLDHDHDHDHEPGREVRSPAHQDHNLRAAYAHVLADALTSVLAIVALVAGKFFGWTWLDPVMGLVGAIVITHWSYGLLRDTSHVLLDGAADERTRTLILSAIESDTATRVADLHIWHVGARHFAVSLTVVSSSPQAPDYYKQRLQHIPDIGHVVIEVNAAVVGAV